MFLHAVAYYIADVVEFNTGAPVDKVPAEQASELEAKKRRRKRQTGAQELLLVNGYIGIVNGYYKFIHLCNVSN